MAILALGRPADRLILWPSTDRRDSGTAVRRALPFAGGSLEVLVARSASRLPELYVLRFYGNADRADEWIADETKSLGREVAVEAWGVNYPGYGGSTGPASLQGIAAAAVAAYDALKREAGVRPIVVVGTSLGTTAALHVAAERAVAGVVLHNPPALRELIVGEHGWWNLWLLAWPISRQVPSALDSVANARRVHAPAVFVLSALDEVVPHRYHRLIYDAYGGQKEALVRPRAHHNTPLDDEAATAYDAAVGRLLRRAVAPPADPPATRAF